MYIKALNFQTSLLVQVRNNKDPACVYYGMFLLPKGNNCFFVVIATCDQVVSHIFVILYSNASFNLLAKHNQNNCIIFGTCCLKKSMR